MYLVFVGFPCAHGFSLLCMALAKCSPTIGQIPWLDVAFSYCLWQGMSPIKCHSLMQYGLDRKVVSYLMPPATIGGCSVVVYIS